MGVFSAAPKSFKVDRKSHFAAKLKSLIFDHLLHSFSDYADDVLAEYIMVLVCNGKNQNQAGEDLAAFLGERSEEFVSWLWDILLKYEPSLTAGISSDGKEKTYFNSPDTCKENDNTNGKFRGPQSQGNRESDNLMLPKEIISRTIQSSGSQSKSANVNSSTKVVSSLGEHQSESFDTSDKPSSFPRRHPGTLAQSGPLSDTRSCHGSKLSELPQMHCKRDALERSISPLQQVVSSHDEKPRRSVWDRLGKPQAHVPPIGQTANFDVMENTNISKKSISQRPPVIHKHNKQIVQLSSFYPACTDCPVKVKEVHQVVERGRANKISDSKGADDVAETISQIPSVNNIRRKRHFGDLTSQGNDDTTVEVVPQARKRPELSLEAAEVVDSVCDVKLRLRQVEIEMAKLRSKQIKMETDGKANLLMNHGVVKPAEEDTGSRTVLVTNVHYKATKEALSMYFGKCGAVVNVLLTDNKPSPLQRSAYITFGSKESADKALVFSGTTFYSRTILVSRKRDKAFVSLAKFAGGSSQIHASQPKFSVTLDKTSFRGSHLQWRRESLTSTHSESPTSNVEQMRGAAASVSQWKHSAASISEQYGDLKHCPPASVYKSDELET